MGRGHGCLETTCSASAKHGPTVKNSPAPNVSRARSKLLEETGLPLQSGLRSLVNPAPISLSSLHSCCWKFPFFSWTSCPQPSLCVPWASWTEWRGQGGEGSQLSSLPPTNFPLSLLLLYLISLIPDSCQASGCIIPMVLKLDAPKSHTSGLLKQTHLKMQTCGPHLQGLFILSANMNE